jgi:RNA polymerase sigma-70 factor (ECF subfamily)
VNEGEMWQELLSKIATDSCHDSFKKIFHHFYPLLISHGLKNGLSKEISTELAQETMMRVWDGAHLFDPEKGNFHLWIYVIARNLKYDYLRKQRNDPFKANSQFIYSEQDMTSIDDGHVDMLFDLSQLKEKIQSLSKEQGEIIHKIYFEGKTQQEIANENLIPIGTVKSRLRLAITTIKKLMEEKSI